MPLNTDGSILEGVRLSQSCNTYVYPPDNFVTSDKIPVFNQITRNSDYCIWATGQSDAESGLYIGLDNLSFYWTRNDAITRFGYDNTAARFFPNPGNIPVKLGILSNSPRLKVSRPSVDDLSISPYSIYIGLPRVATLTMLPVTNSSLFTNVSPGFVQVSLVDGECNFSLEDINNPEYSGVSVYYSRQNFYDRSQVKGIIGAIDGQGDYLVYLNPIPGPGSHPLIRIGNRKHLNTILYPSESTMPDPSNPTDCSVALDTGRVKLRVIPEYYVEDVYYDGLALSKIGLSKFSLGTNNVSVAISAQQLGVFPQFIGLTDDTRYVVVGRLQGEPDYYLRVIISDEDPTFGDSGYLTINKLTGAAFLSAGDATEFTDYTFTAYDTYLLIDNLITFKVFRSSLNGIGEVVVPDFVEYYSVIGKTQVNSLSNSPFLFLPSQPLQDGLLNFEVVQNEAGSGFFTGVLKKAEDPNSPGFGYYVNFDQRQLYFTNRKTVNVALEYATSTINLPDSAIYPEGITASINNVPLIPFVDFQIDVNSGTVSFIEPVGELNPINLTALSGTILDSSSFRATSPVFTQAYVGAFVYISSGANAGMYPISQVVDGFNIKVDGLFAESGPETIDIKATRETLASNFWANLLVPLQKFELFRSSSVNGPFQRLSESEYRVQPDAGLIQLASGVQPNEVLKAVYSYEYSDDGGITTSTKSTEELLSSKVRLKPGSYVPGSRYFTFDTENKTVLPNQLISVVVDGNSVDRSKFFFIAPNRIEIGDPLTTEQVFVSYNVAELSGGVRTFNTQNSPVVVDYPIFLSGSNSLSLNGNQTQNVKTNTALLVQSDVYIVNSSIYDAESNTTEVIFTTSIVNDFRGYFSVSDPVSFIILNETYKTVLADSTSMVVIGQSTVKPNELIRLDNDPYYVISTNFDETSNTTTIVLNRSSLRNYIAVQFERSTDIIRSAGDEFNTSKSALTSLPFTLFFESNSVKRQFTPIVDYSVSDGGTIKLKKALVKGDKLYVMYVARENQPAGTVLNINYACSLSPTEENGLLGQKLNGSFRIYSPDSFYFRDSTIINYVPEVSAAVGVTNGPSGPSTGASPAQGVKDAGIASLAFPEKRFANLDNVTSRLLFYFNKLTNMYEDLLSNYDGRVVGGTSGKFRYDGLSGSKRNSYGEITNDIDDLILSHYDWQGVDDFPYFAQIPIYIPLYDYSTVSRIFPTKTTRNFIINSNVGSDNRGKVMSNIGVTEINDLSFVFSSPAVSHFESADGLNLVIKTNGDRRKFVPAFAANMPVNLYDNYGKFHSTGVVSSVSGSGPYLIVLQSPTSLRSGGITLDNQKDAGDTSATWPNNRLYKSIDYNIDNSTGNLINATYAVLVAVNLQSEFVAQDYLTVSAEYVNKNTAPKRLPVLDGSTLTDSGFPSLPPLFRSNETSCLEAEASYLQSTTTYGYAVVVATNRIQMVGSNPFIVGDSVQFMTGPNQLVSFQLVSAEPNAIFVTNASLVINATNQFITKIAEVERYLSALDELIKVQSVNVSTLPGAGQYIGSVDNEIAIKNQIVLYMGETILTGSGSVNQNVLTSNDTLPFPLTACYIYVASGVNSGLYKVLESTLSTITVSNDSPYYGFPVSGSVSFTIIKRYSFMGDSGPGFLASAIKNDNQFIAETAVWKANINWFDLSARNFQVVSRQSELTSQINSCQNMLKNGDALYNKRYIWISQRADKKSGFLTGKVQAQKKREEDTIKLIENQQKALALQALQTL